MTAVPAARKMIQIEETDYNTAVSESVAQKIGAQNNFINLYQYDTKWFEISGPYHIGLGDEGVAASIMVPFNMEIIGVYMINFVAGSSGTTELDVIARRPGSGSLGSIFSTTPKMTSATGDKAGLGRIFASGQEASYPASSGGGYTLPELAITQLNAFDWLYLKITDAQVAARNATLGLWLRPR